MNEGFKNSQDVAMYFHSSFRNVALFISLTFASMAAATKYINDANFDYVIIVFISMMFLIISLLLNYFLLSRIVFLANKFKGLNLWILTSIIMFILQILLLIFGSHMLYINIYNK